MGLALRRKNWLRKQLLSRKISERKLIRLGKSAKEVKSKVKKDCKLFVLKVCLSRGILLICHSVLSFTKNHCNKFLFSATEKAITCKTMNYCGDKGWCPVDPLFPNTVNCRCWIGFKLNDKNVCVGESPCGGGAVIYTY